MARFELEQVNTLWFMTLGVTALSAGVLVYVLLLESALGTFSIKEFYPASDADREPPRIALLASEYSRTIRQINPEDSTARWLDNLLATWHEFLSSPDYDFPYSRISDRDLESGLSTEYFDVLILPAALAMSDREVDNVLAFMRNGGSVYASWMPGYYREDGSVRGWSFLQEAFGVEVVDFVDRYQGNYRAHESIHPGSTEPGIYLPVLPGAPALQTTQSFAPLRQYRLVAPTTAPPPREDYVLADTLTLPLRDVDGLMTPQKAVKLTFYSWQGDRTGRESPYAYTGYGMEQFAMRGNTVLTAGIPGGYSFNVQVFDPALRLHITGDSTDVVGYWGQWGRHLQPDSLVNHTGIVYGVNFGSRFVYSGFRRDAMGIGNRNEEDVVVIDRFFINVMNYLRRAPSAWLRDWPAPYDAAAIITAVGDGDLRNLHTLADSLLAENLRADFFLRAPDAPLPPAVVQTFVRAGRVGLLDAPGSDRGESSLSHENRLATVKTALETETGVPVTSYKPADAGRVSKRLLRALQFTGFTTVLPDSIATRTAPEVLRDIAPLITQFNSPSGTDIEFLHRQPDADPATIQHMMATDYERVHMEGGVYQLVVHDTGLARAPYRSSVLATARALRQDKFWMGTADEIGSWWRQRQAIQVSLNKNSDARVVLQISNQNSETARQLSLLIDLGRPVVSIQIRPELIGGPVPQHELIEGNTMILMKVSALRPLQTRLYHIDIVPEGMETLASSVIR
ncbi:MAG: hypothetical protein R2834_09845 [Rhodothermales bacterium]